MATRALFPSDEGSKALTPPLSRTSRAEADSHLAVPGGRASMYGDTPVPASLINPAVWVRADQRAAAGAAMTVQRNRLAINRG